MGAVPKRKPSTHRKGKRRTDLKRKFHARVLSLISRKKRLESKSTNLS